MRRLCGIGLVLYCGGVAAQSVQTVLSKPQVLVGEAFTVSVGVAGREVVFAGPSLSGGDSVSRVELLGYRDTDSTDEAGRPVAWRVYRLVCLWPGAWVFPAQSVSVRTATGRVRLRGRAVRGYAELVSADTPDLRPEPPLTLHRPPPGWWPYALVWGAMAVGGGLFWLKRRKRPAKRLRNPYRLARRRIGLLARKTAAQEEKAMLAQLDGLMRDYLTHQFGLPAHHLGPAEIARRLTGMGVRREAVQATETVLGQMQAARFSPAGMDVGKESLANNPLAGLIVQAESCLQLLAESASRRPPSFSERSGGNPSIREAAGKNRSVR